jgi:hypothetical protein
MKVVETFLFFRIGFRSMATTCQSHTEYVVTHAHKDVCDALRRSFPQAEVIIMRRESRSLAFPWLLGFAAVTAQAQQTIVVNPGDSIQNAVNQAAAGDTVLVPCRDVRLSARASAEAACA